MRKGRIIFAAAVAVSSIALAQNAGGGATEQPKTGQTWQQGSQTGQKMGESGQSGMPSQPMTAQNFIQMAINENTIDMKVAERVSQEAQDPQVKELAQKLTLSHQQMIDKLQAIADKQDIKVNKQLTAKDQQRLDQMQKLTGDQLTQAFLKHEHLCTQAMIGYCQQAATKLDDPALKDFAQQHISKLELEQQKIQSVAQAAGVDVSQAEQAGGRMPGADDQDKASQQQQPSQK